MPPATLSVVVVFHDSLPGLERSLPLLAEPGEEDELLLVENAPGSSLPTRERQLAPRARVLRTGESAEGRR